MTRLVYILCVLFPAFCFGQTAPDFSVTDVLGKSHVLYGNYLMKGKTVLLKIFYSTCPPCNAQADAVQDLYEAWGEGAGDVEFIEVSNQTWETNQTALNYVNEHDITFPTVSAAGGSLQAVGKYIGGGFGSFFGTPTYIVIAPDGKLVWNVSLSNLDAAIAATGAEKEGSSGILHETYQNALWIAPNPSSDLLNIYGGDLQHSGVSVSIFDMFGRLVMSGYTGEDDPVLLREDISGWISGTYLVRVQSEGKMVKTLHFIKQ